MLTDVLCKLLQHIILLICKQLLIYFTVHYLMYVLCTITASMLERQNSLVMFYLGYIKSIKMDAKSFFQIEWITELLKRHVLRTCSLK